MFSEYEDTLNQFIKVLGKSNPDEFTQREWDLIWAYTKSDGCTGVADIFLISIALQLGWHWVRVSAERAFRIIVNYWSRCH